MAVDFDAVDDIAHTIAALYGEAELALTRRITRQLAAGMDAPGWARAKLDAVGALRDAARAIVAALGATLSRTIRAELAAAYRDGWGDALSELVDRWAPNSRIGERARAARDVVPGTRAIEALAASIVSDLRGVHERITREALDAYRAVVAAATARTVTGAATRREAAQAAWLGLVQRGLVKFTDRSGRDWRLSSYVEMALRTVTARAAMQGHEDALREIDSRLVYVSDAVQECALCRPWEHQVLALWGPVGSQLVEDELTGEPTPVDVAATLAEARALGLHHPNCRHNISAYFPGLTRLAPAVADPDGDRARQRQRYLERRIRQAKEEEAAALSPAAATAARRKVRARQAALREHLAQHPELKRLRYREQIGAGNVPNGTRRDDAAGAIGPDQQDTIAGRPETPPRRRLVDDVDQAAELDTGPVQDGPDLFDPSNVAPAEPVDPLAGVDLAALEDVDLFALWEQYPDDESVSDRLAAELARRDEQAAEQVDEPDAGDQVDEPNPFDVGSTDAFDAGDDGDAEQVARELRIDELVARGWEYAEAYAEVYGLDPEELARQERQALIDADRRAGETREQAVRRAYDEWVHTQYLAAEQATRGHLLSAQGQARGIDPIELFSGPAHVARANASEDLLRWWADNGGRRTYTEFRAEILGRATDRAEAERIRGRGNARDFGV